MSRPCAYCGVGRYKWLQQQVITSDEESHRISVNMFRCTSCGHLFIVDKGSINPNRLKSIDKDQKARYIPNTPKNTYDEQVFFGIMYINSKGKYGVKPKDYVSTKPYELGGKIYPPIRKARVRGNTK